MSSAVGPSAARDDVLVRRENGILIVTINRPDQRNAVNGAVVGGIARALDLLDGDVRAAGRRAARQRHRLLRGHGPQGVRGRGAGHGTRRAASPASSSGRPPSR